MASQITSNSTVCLQQLVQIDNQEYTKALHYWSFMRGIRQWHVGSPRDAESVSISWRHHASKLGNFHDNPAMGKLRIQIQTINWLETKVIAWARELCQNKALQLFILHCMLFSKRVSMHLLDMKRSLFGWSKRNTVNSLLGDNVYAWSTAGSSVHSKTW